MWVCVDDLIETLELVLSLQPEAAEELAWMLLEQRAAARGRSPLHTDQREEPRLTLLERPSNARKRRPSSSS